MTTTRTGSNPGTPTSGTCVPVDSSASLDVAAPDESAAEPLVLPPSSDDAPDEVSLDDDASVVESPLPGSPQAPSIAIAIARSRMHSPYRHMQRDDIERTLDQRRRATRRECASSAIPVITAATPTDVSTMPAVDVSYT